MRLRTTFKWLASLAVVAYAASPAGAQVGGGGAAPAASGQVGFQRKTQLTAQEQLQEVDRHVSRMELGARSIRKQLEEARQKRDVVKTLCLNDKLSQIDTAVGSVRDRRKSLEGAAKSGDTASASHDYNVSTIQRQRAEQLLAEANQCVGEETSYLGDSKVTTTVDPGIATEDAEYPPTTNPVPIANPPYCTSCTL